MIFVYHSKNFRDSSGFGLGECFTDADAIHAWEGDGYEFVGMMNTDSLDDAYQMTNHIDCPWTDICDGEIAVENPRSSSVGDIFVHIASPEMARANHEFDPTIYAVDRMGFKKLRDLTPHELVRLIRSGS